MSHLGRRETELRVLLALAVRPALPGRRRQDLPADAEDEFCRDCARVTAGICAVSDCVSGLDA
ncbi:hypothetical protein [Streptomyces sp. NPDC001536]|uniref:hypothetical protein n=1 Tax=Streptomyces sp. NPDC001536 TaxID=3364583 RepID=UPI00368BC107